MTRTIYSTARLAAAVALVAALAGCGKSPTGITDNLAAQANADDAAQQVGASMAQDNGGMASTYGATPAPPGDLTAHPIRIAEPAWAASETTFTSGGITYTFTRQYLNQYHNGMAYFDPLVTWGIAETWRASGGISGTQFSATIGRAGTLNLWNVSTAAPDTVSMNGTSDDTLQCSFVSVFNGSQHYFYSQMAGVMTDVMVPKPITSNYPASGNLTWVISADRLRSSSRGDIASHFDATVVVTFNGTRFPNVTVNGSYRYTIDLKTGLIARA